MELRAKVHDVITKIKEYNETNKKEQSLPVKFVQELLKIFCEELERQNVQENKLLNQILGFVYVLMKKKEKDINNNWELMKNVLISKSIRDMYNI